MIFGIKKFTTVSFLIPRKKAGRDALLFFIVLLQTAIENEHRFQTTFECQEY